MKTNYKHRFDRIIFSNRWANNWMPSDWTIIGIHQRWASPQEYEFMICFFGFSIRIWMYKELR